MLADCRRRERRGSRRARGERTSKVKGDGGSKKSRSDETGTLEQYATDIQEAYDAVEEQEVWSLASPDKDEQDNTPLRQQMEEYPATNSGRLRRQRPFVTMRQPLALMIGTQFMPAFRTADTTSNRLERLMEEIGGLREDIRNSNRDTNIAPLTFTTIISAKSLCSPSLPPILLRSSPPITHSHLSLCSLSPSSEHGPTYRSTPWPHQAKNLSSSFPKF